MRNLLRFPLGLLLVAVLPACGDGELPVRSDGAAPDGGVFDGASHDGAARNDAAPAPAASASTDQSAAAVSQAAMPAKAPLGSVSPSTTRPIDAQSAASSPVRPSERIIPRTSAPKPSDSR